MISFNKRFVSSCLPVLAFALFVILASRDSLAQYQTIRVFGKVTDNEGGSISKANVSFIPDGSEEVGSATTDTSGIYSIKLTYTETGIYDNPSLTPHSYRLNQNYPNPFNPSTTVTFELLRPSHINLTVFNLKGQLVRKLADGNYSTGISWVIWDGTDDAGRCVSAGIYIYRIESEGSTTSKKMLLVDGDRGTTLRSPGGPVLSSLQKLQRTLLQNSYTIRVEKQGFDPFVEENYAISFSDSVVEKNISLRRLDYFPLEVGNSWTFVYKIPYQDQKEVTFSITGKEAIDDHEYYEFNTWPWFLPLYSEVALMRKTQQLDLLLRIANEDIPIYEFSNTILDSLREIHIDSLPYYPDGADLIIQLTSVSDTLITPAGTFVNCYELISGIKQEADSGTWIWFAPDIGPVRFQPSNVEIDYRLKSACINGRYYRPLNLDR